MAEPRIYDHQSEVSSCDFLWQVHQAAPMKITKRATDNGSQFRDRFMSKGKEPSGGHKFDKRCVGLGIEHRLIAPRHPQTNGRVERFNGRISEVLGTDQIQVRGRAPGHADPLRAGLQPPDSSTRVGPSNAASRIAKTAR